MKLPISFLRYLLLPVLLWPTFGAQAAMSLAGKQDRRAFMEAVKAAFVKEDYASLESTVDELHTTKDRFPEGVWTLAIFYNAIELDGLSSEVAEHIKDRLDRWKAAYPRSLAERIVEIRALQNHTWDGTGRGMPGGSKREAQVYTLLQEAEKLTPQPGPEWHDAMLEYANRWAWSREKHDAIYQRAIAAEPGYQTFYFDRAVYLRNQGQPGDWEAFALDAGRHGLSGEGMGLYSRIAWSLSEYTDDNYLFKQTAIQWPLMRDGFRELDRLYPNSDWNLNNFCRFACMAGDRETARELFARIGDRWASNWMSHAAFKQWSNWAAAQSVPAARDALRLVAEDPAHPNAWALRFAPDGGSLFAGYDAGRLLRWDLGTSKVLWQGQLGTEGSLNAMTISPDGNWLAAGTAARLRRPNVHGEIGVWDLRATPLAAKPTRRMEPSLAGVHCVRFAPDGRTLAASGFNQITNVFGELRLWSLPDWKEIRHIKDFSFPIPSVAFLPPRGEQLAFGFSASFDVVSTESWAHLFWPDKPLHQICVSGIDVSPDGKTLVCTTQDGFENRDRPCEITFWNTADWTRRDSPHITNAGGMFAVTFSPDGRWLLGGGFDGILRVWDTETGKTVVSWTPEQGAGKIDAVAFSPDGKKVAAAREDDAVTVYPFAIPEQTVR